MNFWQMYFVKKMFCGAGKGESVELSIFAKTSWRKAELAR